MKRRRFLQLTSAGSASAVAGGSGLLPGTQSTSQNPAGLRRREAAIDGLSLADLKKQYEYDLYEDFLPFFEKYVIDREYGGFMCNVDRDGTRISTNKDWWLEGRGIWTYSFLYNNLAKEQRHLDAAAKAVDFFMARRPSGDFWVRGMTREGKPFGEPVTDFYPNLFLANGLAEFSKAAGEPKYWDLAKEILLRAIESYDRPDYPYHVTYGPEVTPFRGERVGGHWMVLINTTTGMLETRADAEVEAVARRSVEAVMKFHHNPAYDLTNEVLNHDLSRPANDFSQFSYTGHAIETFWMILYEAVRRKDSSLFDLAARRFRRHVEVAWDDVYGGCFRSLDNVDKNIWKIDKNLWVQEEVLIGSLFIIEHTDAAWAKEIFGRMFRYVHDKFPLKKHGYPLWILGGDRKVTFVPHAERVDVFHHPRHLMLNLLSLKRMMAALVGT